MKSDFRMQLKTRLGGFSALDHQQSSQVICEKLTRCPLFQKAQTICAYWPFKQEVDIKPLLLDPTLQKNWFLPIVLEKREMAWAPFSPLNSALLPNRYGILEPQITSHEWLSDPKAELILLPCLGFDEQGHRLGYGQGYYDFFFKKIPNIQDKQILLAFECQRLTSILPDPWDVPACFVLTEGAS